MKLAGFTGRKAFRMTAWLIMPVHYAKQNESERE